MATQENQKRLNEVCIRILAFFDEDHPSLVRRPEWGSITFEAGEATMDSLRQLATLIVELPFDLAPEDVVQNTSSYLDSAAGTLSEIDGFDSVQRTGADRDNLVNTLNSHAQAALQTIGSWLAVAGVLSGKLQAWTSEAKQTRDNLQRVLDQATGYATEQRAAIDAAVDAARAASAEAGAAAFTEDFRKEADARKSRGRQWLWAAATSAMLALGLAGSIVFGWGIDPAQNGWQAIVDIGGRVMGFSVLLYATVWCSRIVLANLHQESVNMHRANSIKTLQAFREAVADSTVKDAVVLEAARATFENVPPGFVAKASADQGSGPVRILETVRRAARDSDAST